jgi:hypothetical protein
MDVGRTLSVLDLHKEVQSTDSQLATMSNMLQGFQSEMSTLSDQIQTLLDASVSMKAKLENREQVEVALHNITHHVTIDEELINGVCNGEVSENYVKYLVKLDKVRTQRRRIFSKQMYLSCYRLIFRYLRGSAVRRRFHQTKFAPSRRLSLLFRCSRAKLLSAFVNFYSPK